MTDIDAPYLIGCATKYVTRWRGKNGMEDLEKAGHYIDKIIERGVRLEGDPYTALERHGALERFCSQLSELEAAVITCLCTNNPVEAREELRHLIDYAKTQEI